MVLYAVFEEAKIRSKREVDGPTGIGSVRSYRVVRFDGSRPVVCVETFA